MRQKTLHIVFAGGGTLGHLFPGLAVAAELKRLAPDARLSFAGAGKRAEQLLVKTAGHAYQAIACRPRPNGMTQAIRFVADHVRGFHQAARYLRTQHVDLVVGLGGYASYPMAQAAIVCQVPLVLLEQNAVPGLSTRRLAPYARLICVAFEEARQHLAASGPVRITGNPVRHMPHTIHGDAGRYLLVLGGSQGSQSLNASVPLALAGLQAKLTGWNIVHQAGEAGAAATARLYGQLGLKAHVSPFIANLPRVMARCHLTISRAGGTTLAELAAAGLPAIVVPYPAASDQHQLRNAEVFAAR
ncbi:MAG TPA: UDP-N-acetylglucosamine--N-acetylmuramyl-(pentapeptide) pyrophosphoryl-undecaprenol N-acetylglucosamine transferase, partial [Castellaniella sp.]|nr:UDP-N-acetylglucosamine--N-acetylmuramyl-(pentapeptide) pyrophosphoryl-undecaprenol N-acetylglucosamine transferase [Castellaniella sp.]